MVWIADSGPARTPCTRKPQKVMNGSCDESFLEKIGIIVPCFTKTAPWGWESREEPCVCLLLENALIYFRMQCLWSAAQRCVCSAKCILFIWVSVRVCASSQSHVLAAPFVCLSVPFWVFCLCGVVQTHTHTHPHTHTHTSCMCACNASLKGWRQDWTAVAA